MKSIIEFYSYLFYRSYSWYSNFNLLGKNDIPEYSAIALLSLKFSINILTVLIVILDNSFFDGTNKLTMAIIITVVMFLNGIYFIPQKRYIKIYELFAKESKQERTYKGRYVFMYNFLTIFLFFLSIFIIKALRNS